MSPYDIAQLQLQITKLKEQVSRLERREALIVRAIDDGQRGAYFGAEPLREQLEKREP